MQIQNEYITASFDLKGAELQSLIHKSSHQEYMWEANPEHWGRVAPVLFPFIGKSKDKQYQIDGNTYPMGQHGFVRDMEFRIEQQTTNEVTFLLTSNAETLKKYPFTFELRLKYTLTDQQLICSYQVVNTNDKTMYFSIGGHPAFKCPLNEGEKRSDYRLIFDKKEVAETHLLKDGLFSGETDRVFSGNTIGITDELFDRDALVFKGLNSNAVIMQSDNNAGLRFTFEGFPYLGIWSKSQKSPFVCIEPWFGLADNESHDGDLTKKEGVQTLDAGDIFDCAYGIEIL